MPRQQSPFRGVFRVYLTSRREAVKALLEKIGRKHFRLNLFVSDVGVKNTTWMDKVEAGLSAEHTGGDMAHILRLFRRKANLARKAD